MPGYFTTERRRRLATIGLFAGLFVVWSYAAKDAPRDQEVRYLLTPEQQKASSVRVVYAQEDEEITAFYVRYPEGAPAQVVHTPALSPGRYDLSIDLGYRDGRVERLAKTLTVPSEEAVRIHLRASP